jgi:hypothetical protein
MENDMKDPDLAEKLKDYVMTNNDLLCIEIAEGYSRNASYLMKVIPETHRT